MIESLTPLAKKQFLELANHLQIWLKAHPHPEEDAGDSWHKAAPSRQERNNR